MQTAILSDIHGNREALTAVLADAAARGISRFVILGDIVGYGPDPEWCLERVQALAAGGAMVVKGNHDAAIESGAQDMNAVARAAIDWTRPRLTPEARAWLRALPVTQAEGDALYTHASAHCPEDWIYVTSEREANFGFRSTEAALVFCGHVHIPALYSADLAGRVQAHPVKPGVAVPLLTSRRWMAVAGAVGQPRDGSPQAAWLLLDPARRELSFRRTPYDVAETMRKIREAGLPAALADRLGEGI